MTALDVLIELRERHGPEPWPATTVDDVERELRALYPRSIT
jgi:hypothetical protein